MCFVLVSRWEIGNSAKKAEAWAVVGKDYDAKLYLQYPAALWVGGIHWWDRLLVDYVIFFGF